MPIEEVEYRPLGKKHDWVKNKNNKESIIFEMRIWQDGIIIDTFKFDTKDGFKKITEIVKINYGL